MLITRVAATTCFNPWRVFSWLATLDVLPLLGPWMSFNPWRVFSWLATERGWRAFSRGAQVSIPGGFFRGLQPGYAASRHDRGCQVSIPGGFFRGLQRWRRWWMAGELRCFNPWRVFSWLATSCRLWWPSSRLSRFQSLAGFFVACN